MGDAREAGLERGVEGSTRSVSVLHFRHSLPSADVGERLVWKERPSSACSASDRAAAQFSVYSEEHRRHDAAQGRLARDGFNTLSGPHFISTVGPIFFLSATAGPILPRPQGQRQLPDTALYRQGSCS